MEKGTAMKMKSTGKKTTVIELRFGQDNDQKSIDNAYRTCGYGGRPLVVWASPTGAKVVRIGKLYYKVFSGFQGRRTVRLNKPYCDPKTGKPVVYDSVSRPRRKLTTAQKNERTYNRAVAKARKALSKLEFAALGL